MPAAPCGQMPALGHGGSQACKEVPVCQHYGAAIGPVPGGGKAQSGQAVEHEPDGNYGRPQARVRFTMETVAKY